MLVVEELINTSRAETIQRVAKAQEEVGTSYLDVNCGNNLVKVRSEINDK